MNNQATPPVAIARHSATTLRFATGDLAKAQYVDAKHLDAALARIAELEKTPIDHKAEPAQLRFPTMLRKMWSGGEVQQWLEEQGPLYRLAPESNELATLNRIKSALKFYADGDHYTLCDPDIWDTCSGEPQNILHDSEGTASIEDGTIARVALALLSNGAQ